MNDLESFSQNHAESSQSASLNRPSGSGSSGLTLILPSLKSVQALKKSGQKAQNGVQDVPETKKIPRPVKLKPLKEVLTKLIAQIKKKDDYAFFLSPVDVAKVPGYTDVVKRPMDLGTMTTKVAKGRYRSLEEFSADFRLVTSNAKTFNPPGTIYHAEADRIEVWGLEHISKAASTVIEYETDWNIEIEADEEHTPVNIDGDDDNVGTPMDIDGDNRGARSPSVASTQIQSSRRGPRGPYKRAANTLSESIDAEGRLPGSKDGLGAFPPGSDWAELMVALKLKGKRYRTKKERLRVEKEGPPCAADGSLDYAEMEDPFSVLSVFASEPESRPYLEPLYPTVAAPDISQPLLPAPVNILSDHGPPQLTTLSASPSKSKKRRHWYIVRNVTNRTKGKEKEDEEAPSWQLPRETQTTDFGSFATLVERLAQEMRARDVGASLGSEETLFNAIRASVEGMGDTDSHAVNDHGHGVVTNRQEEGYWTAQRAVEAGDYIRDIVYGGVDGLAYVRSLAEFLRYPPASVEGNPSTSDLGMPLTQWVEQSIVDPLTEGRHQLLREAALHLYSSSPPDSPSIATQIALSLTAYPLASHHLSQLQQISTHQIDMAALIHTPNELFLSENEWVGATYKQNMEEEKEKVLDKNAAEYLAYAIQTHKEAEASTGIGPATGVVGTADGTLEGPEVFGHALEFTAEKILELERRRVKEGTIKAEAVEGSGGEDAVMRKLRLNLLALAKRAPLDKIARLPADLVPEHIRHIVPTLTS